eukprot:GCRY01005274.1.p1 GENE.GCRY01005274.1~~GCRY01005274.1.p1  ORF type:complete len:313 (-),score=37.66 GCRY01005274.1:220-1158(-)
MGKKEKQSVSILSEEELSAREKCCYFIEKKNRFCNFPKWRNFHFCALHVPNVERNDGRKRIPCPLNPNHSIFEDQLKKHLLHCPDALERKISIEVYSNGINRVSSSNSPGFSLDSFTETEFQSLKTKLENYDFPEKTLLCKPDFSSETKTRWFLKHERQHEALHQLLVGHGLLQDSDYETTVLELGAGKGGLSRYFSDTYGHRCVCLDNTHYRRAKKDEKRSLERMFVDVVDFDMKKFFDLRTDAGEEEETQTPSPRVVVACKHLCGAAMDWAIRSADNAQQYRSHQRASGLPESGALSNLVRFRIWDASHI